MNMTDQNLEINHMHDGVSVEDQIVQIVFGY